MVDAATHRQQLVELAGISADVALISAQSDASAPAGDGGGGYSDLTVALVIGRFLRWSMVNQVAALALIAFVFAAFIYGLGSFIMAVGEVE